MSEVLSDGEWKLKLMERKKKNGRHLELYIGSSSKDDFAVCGAREKLALLGHHSSRDGRNAAIKVLA
jgi:hypothetical protein